MSDTKHQDEDTIPLNRGASNEDDTEDMDSHESQTRAPLLSLSSRIKSIIEEGHEGSEHLTLTNRMLFTQLDVLSHFDDGQTGWKEMARWLKYQELVENGDRWSKPHVPTGSMHSINEIRRLIADGSCAVGLGLHSDSPGPNYIGEALIQTLKNNSKTDITDKEAQQILETILKPHKHMHRKASHKKGTTQNGGPNHSISADNNNEGDKHKKGVLRIREGVGTDISLSYNDYPQGARPDNLKPYKPNKHLGKKLPKGCEAANILVGQVNYLKHNVVGFCRFDPPQQMGDLTEVDVPTRFIFVALGPKNSSNIWELSELGKAIGSLLNDKVFSEVAYKARSREDLLDAVDEFIDDLTVLPPSIWDCNTRLEPPANTRSMDKIMLRLDETERVKGKPTAPPQEEGAGEDPSLVRTGKIFGGLIYDIKHRYKYYLSDLKDGLHIQCLASTIFLFFACISPIVTFGGLMGQATNGYMGTMEMLLAGAICGFFYAMFAGQPLTIIGATGPLLIFESILFRMCHENEIDFLSLRFWVGAWVAICLLVIVAFDLSALVRFITRFTEESFSILISVIFIYEAFHKVYEISHNFKVRTGVIREIPALNCFCVPAESITKTNVTKYNDTASYNTSYTVPTNWTYKFPEQCTTMEDRLVIRTDCLSVKDCLNEYNGTLSGDGCNDPNVISSVPDVFFMSVILFLGTYSLAMAFRNFRTSRYCPSIVRTTIADFAVFLSIVTWTGIDYMFGLDTPKLNVPKEFVTTRDDRSWVVNPGAVTYIWLIPLAILPALLCTILIFLDQQITAVIVNRREHKLKKGHGYHLDLLVLAALILVCSLLGLPWFVAATVRALTHVKSLVRESEVSIPGERPQMLGVREQRITGMAIHLLIGLSTLVTGLLRMIPMPVLYGVFLYMGFTSLGGVQFIERVGVLFMPMKYQPDYIYLRHVRVKRVHLFTIIQLVSFITMWCIKSIKVTAIAFPVMLIILMAVRKVLDFIFTQSELYWLDHLLPDDKRREEEDRRKGSEMDAIFTDDFEMHNGAAAKKAAEAYA